MNNNKDDEIIAEFEQRTEIAIMQTRKAISAAKAWFYDMTGISLITPDEINNNDEEDKR